MDHFTPLTAIAGGLLIGLATALYFLLVGRYAGLSGIARSAAFGDPDRNIDAVFIVGMLCGGSLWFAFGPSANAPQATTGLWVVAVAGLFVGAGTALGNGCTSGHGVCGLGRLSLRSLVAVATFMATAIATVYIVRHLLVVV
ncbi:MAG: YeeE/YedE family protein [Vulcanimicrobiaceae bacterium]